jgi:hypothetical protein
MGIATPEARTLRTTGRRPVARVEVRRFKDVTRELYAATSMGSDPLFAALRMP